jgi:hypothetical protein
MIPFLICFNLVRDVYDLNFLYSVQCYDTVLYSVMLPDLFISETLIGLKIFVWTVYSFSHYFFIVIQDCELFPHYMLPE